MENMSASVEGVRPSRVCRNSLMTLLMVGTWMILRIGSTFSM